MKKAARICPVLWNKAPIILVIYIYLLLSNLFVRVIATRHKIPPHKLYIRDTICPAKIDARRIRTSSTRLASLQPNLTIKSRVIIFASPSFMPGIGAKVGSAASIINIVNAIVV